ncbi:MAG: beta-lactamase family protein [Oscillospiraceae bacterium]|nr:beta-lactamase family protein [Oscillospiraceae bacterium]
MGFEQVANYIDQVLIAEKAVPGVSVTVMRDHKLLYRHCSGNAAMDNSCFMYSCTKPVTAAVIMRLAEEGRLSLQDPVASYLPAFSQVYRKKNGCRIPVNQPITVYHLLTMSAGFDYSLITDSVQNGKLMALVGNDASTREIADGFASFPLQFEPGERFCYGICHDILAAVAEVVTEMPFADYVKSVLFDPSGMSHSTYCHTPSVLEKVAPQYLFWEDKLSQTDTVNQHVLTPNYHSGGAGMISTPEDYRLFADMMACGGIGANGYRFLKPETVALFSEPHISYEGPEGYRYGLGVRVSPTGEFGWDGAAGSCVMMDPKIGVSIFMGMHVLNWPALIGNAHFVLRDLVYNCL